MEGCDAPSCGPIPNLVLISAGTIEGFGKANRKSKTSALFRRDVAAYIAKDANPITDTKDSENPGVIGAVKTHRGVNAPQCWMGRFARSDSQEVALTGIRRRFRIVASEIRGNYSFYELRGKPSPITERDFVDWSSIFSPRATFANYVGYSRKASHFLGQLLARGAEEVPNVIASLKFQGDGNIAALTSSVAILRSEL